MNSEPPIFKDEVLGRRVEMLFELGAGATEFFPGTVREVMMQLENDNHTLTIRHRIIFDDNIGTRWVNLAKDMGIRWLGPQEASRTAAAAGVKRRDVMTGGSYSYEEQDAMNRKKHKSNISVRPDNHHISPPMPNMVGSADALFPTAPVRQEPPHGLPPPPHRSQLPPSTGYPILQRPPMPSMRYDQQRIPPAPSRPLPGHAGGVTYPPPYMAPPMPEEPHGPPPPAAAYPFAAPFPQGPTMESQHYPMMGGQNEPRSAPTPPRETVKEEPGRVPARAPTVVARKPAVVPPNLKDPVVLSKLKKRKARMPSSITALIRYMDTIEPGMKYYARQQDKKGECSVLRGKLRKCAMENPDHPAFKHWVDTAKWDTKDVETRDALIEVVKGLIDKHCPPAAVC